MSDIDTWSAALVKHAPPASQRKARTVVRHPYVAAVLAVLDVVPSPTVKRNGAAVTVYGFWSETDAVRVRLIQGVKSVKVVAGEHDGFCCRVQPKMIVRFEENGND